MKTWQSFVADYKQCFECGAWFPLADYHGICPVCNPLIELTDADLAWLSELDDESTEEAQAAWQTVRS